MAKDRLITPSYCFILAANFLLYFGFWLLIPVLPFYLSEFFQTGNSTIGIVLSCYTVAALCIRPFSGYLLDTFARKPLYLFAYFIFMMMFGGYLIAGSLYLIYYIPNHSWRLFRNGYSRRKHGSDRHYAIFPPWRRFRLLRAYQQYSYVHRADVRTVSARCRSLFCYDLLLRIRFLHFGFIYAASLVKTPYKPPVKREPISLDRFILMKGLPAGFSLLLLSIPYGMTTNYVAMYARQIGIEHATTGFFFTFHGGRHGHLPHLFREDWWIKRKDNTSNTRPDYTWLCCSFFLLSACVYHDSIGIAWRAATSCFCGVALLLGVGFRHHVSGITIRCL